MRSNSHRMELKGHSEHIPSVRRSTLNKCECVIKCVTYVQPLYFISQPKFVGVHILSEFTLKQTLTYTLVLVILTV